MEAADTKWLKELEEGNRRLKQMYADLSLENRVLKDVIERKLYRQLSGAIWCASCARSTP